MTYKNKEIGSIPTLEMFQEFINTHRNFKCNANDAFAYWRKKGFRYKKGYAPSSVELLIVIYNGVYVASVQKHKRQETGYVGNLFD